MVYSEPRAGSWFPHPWVVGGGGRIRFGAGVSARAPLPDWPEHLALARGLEALGFDSHWLADHPCVGCLFHPFQWSNSRSMRVPASCLCRTKRLGQSDRCSGARNTG